MWSSLWQFTRKHRLPVILVSGIAVFLFSFLTTYYWGSGGGTPRASIVKKSDQQAGVSNEAEKSIESDKSTDTMPLDADNWESFLDYEGKRVRMLGIKRQYRAVNFRKGISTDDPRIATPEGGTLLEPLDRYEGWYRARLPDGTIGWIHESLVRQLDVPKPAADQKMPDTPTLKQSTKELIPDEFKRHNRVVVTEDAVNIRRGPTTKFQRIGRSYKHEELRLYAKQDNWFRVKTIPGDLGWLHADLGDTEFVRKDFPVRNVDLSGATLRFGPQFQLRERRLEGSESKGRVIDEVEDWYQVQLPGGDIGWVQKTEVRGDTQPNPGGT